MGGGAERLTGLWSGGASGTRGGPQRSVTGAFWKRRPVTRSHSAAARNTPFSAFIQPLSPPITHPPI
jgi:hypothetical protein